MKVGKSAPCPMMMVQDIQSVVIETTTHGQKTQREHRCDCGCKEKYVLGTLSGT